MTPYDEQPPDDCSTPIETAVLMDYWLALLTPADEAAVEEHLMTCDRCGERLRAIIALSDGLRALAQSGALRVVVDEPFVQRAAARGRRVRQYAPPSGGSVQCTVSADDDMLVTHLAADLTGAERVDLRWHSPQGAELMRLTDIPVHHATGCVVYQESITLAKGLPSGTMLARLVAVDAQGDERILGEYTFHHTRTIEGSGDT